MSTDDDDWVDVGFTPGPERMETGPHDPNFKHRPIGFAPIARHRGEPVSPSIDALRLRRVMGRREWLPPEPFGPAGWRMIHRDGACSIIVTDGPTLDDPTEWRHASMTRPGEVPDYDDLCRLKRAVWGAAGEAYAVFAPASEHVNVHANALHLWGRPDGAPVLPRFAFAGSI